MKTLLDECIPRRLKYSPSDHECQTVPQAGLAGKKNGALLDLAESAAFQIFVTIESGGLSGPAGLRVFNRIGVRGPVAASAP
jgi:hypothetical protein